MKKFERDGAEMNSQGMTLVELMVCIAITGVVMTISLSFFFTHYKSQHSRRQVNEVQETMPAVLEMLKRDLLQAGWSVPSSLAFYFEDGGTDGSDRIFVSDSSIIDLTDGAGRFANNDQPGCGRIMDNENRLAPISDLEGDQLDLDQDGKVDFAKGEFHYVLTNNADSNLRVVRINDDPEGSQLKLVDMDDQTASLDKDDQVTPAIAYWVDQVDGRRCLLRSDRNSTDSVENLIVAEDVVDLQLQYRLDDSDVLHSGSTGPQANLNRVRLTLVTTYRTYEFEINPRNNGLWGLE
jgi:prepilin-type N-terminal cleavage/methylation domain-containing protein